MLPLAIIAAGGVLGAAGKIYEGQAAKKAAEYNAQVAKKNAVLTLRQAADEERQVKVQGRKVIGDMRANFAASGIQMEGSALDVLAESAANIEADVLNIRFTGQMKADSLMDEARMQRSAGNSAMNASYLGASSSLANAGSDYAKLTRT